MLIDTLWPLIVLHPSFNLFDYLGRYFELWKCFIEAIFDLLVEVAEIMVEELPVLKPFGLSKSLKDSKRSKLLLHNSLTWVLIVFSSVAQIVIGIHRSQEEAVFFSVASSFAAVIVCVDYSLYLEIYLCSITIFEMKASKN